jgi:redox-sensitive bicupin YhaK (pirin superfamily)
MSRPITRVVVTPPPAPGFIGEGHTAVEVVPPTDLAASDPFVLLMDDRLDIKERRQIGGAHPHAGLETVTLVLDGILHDRDEGELGPGDVLWMTAGRGIIHNEAVEAAGTSRILQLWIALPASARGITPRFELVRAEHVPVVRAPGVEARLYSGVSGPLRSATKNIVPVTLVDVKLAAGATFTQELSTSYNGFVYVIDGDVEIGGETLRRGDVGWFAPGASTSLVSRADARGARYVLYAGEPTRDALLQHGPFVAGSAVEIRELYRRFRSGDFISMSHIARQQRAQGATNDDDLLDASPSRP